MVEERPAMAKPRTQATGKAATMSDYEKPPTKGPRRSMGMTTQVFLGAVLLLAFTAVLWFAFHGRL
jgi:hypothetical protein